MLDNRTKLAAIAGVVAVGAAVVVALVGSSGDVDGKIDSSDENVRAEALNDLKGRTDAESVRRLGRLAEDNNLRTALAAIRQLGKARRRGSPTDGLGDAA